MTLAERKLWWHLRRLPLDGSHFRRQATIGPYFADFACHDLRLVIEIDGGQHAEEQQMTADATRTEFLHARGYRVLRFWNNHVLDNIDGVLSTIATAIGARRQSPPPPTPPRRSAWGGELNRSTSIRKTERPDARHRKHLRAIND